MATSWWFAASVRRIGHAWEAVEKWSNLLIDFRLAADRQNNRPARFIH
jgi:hypothetical protein